MKYLLLFINALAVTTAFLCFPAKAENITFDLKNGIQEIDFDNDEVTELLMRSRRSIVYETYEGTKIVKSEGSPALRNHNPDNIERGAFAKRYGSIGDDGRFAVFPDYETGRQALEGLLKTKTYQNLSIDNAMNRYAPGHENDTETYIKFIEKKASVSRNEKLKDLTNAQASAVADAIERFEGSIEGKTIPLPKPKPLYDATGRIIKE